MTPSIPGAPIQELRRSPAAERIAILADESGLLLSHFDPFLKQEASSSKPFLGSMYNEVSEKPFNMDTATVFFTKQLVSPTC